MAVIHRCAGGHVGRRAAQRRDEIDRRRADVTRAAARRTRDPATIDDACAMLARLADRIEAAERADRARVAPARRCGMPPTEGSGHGFAFLGGKRRVKTRHRQGSPSKGRGRGGRMGTAPLGGVEKD